MKIEKNLLALFFCNLLVIGIAALMPSYTVMILTLVLWGDLVIYALMNLEERSSLLAFLASFFTFLIGREALEQFGLHTIELRFPAKYNIMAEKLVFLSLVFFAAGYLLTGLLKPGKKKKRISYHSGNYVRIRKVSKILFFMTYAFNMFVVMDIVVFVFTKGYAAFYNSYVSHVPYVLMKIGDMSPILYWIFLSTMPSKKECKLPTIFYVGYLVISLGTGSRYAFVAGVLTLFVYFVLRNKVNNPLHRPWLKKQHMVVAAAFVPVMIIGMFVINLIRFGRDISGINMMDAFTGFFYGQGVSINFIKRSLVYASRLPSGKWYMFGSTLDFLSDNIIARSLGATTYSGNSVGQALYGNQMSHALSYVVMGKHYLAGHGLGSSYVAELYHDLGYYGIALGNLIYGFIFRRVFRFEGKGIWSTAICFFMLNALMHAGRGSFDSFVTVILDMTTWGTILIVIVVSKMFFRESSAFAAGSRQKT